MPKRIFWPGLGLFCVCAATLVHAADPLVVTQRGRTFGIATLSVPAGAVIRVLNDDEFTHHVIIKSPDFAFDSGEIDRGEHVDVEFDKAGFFAVRCDIHPKMLLEVTVK